VLGGYCLHFFDEVVVEDGRFDVRDIREGSDGGDYNESNLLIRGFPFGVLNRISEERTLRAKRLGNVGKIRIVMQEPMSSPSILMMAGVLPSSNIFPMMPSNFPSLVTTGVGLNKISISFFLVMKRRKEICCNACEMGLRPIDPVGVHSRRGFRSRV